MLAFFLACPAATESADPRVDELLDTVEQQAALIEDLTARLEAVEGAGYATTADVGAQLGELAELAPLLEIGGTEVALVGANLHVRSGAGATDAEPNGLGNLVVGYGENPDAMDRSGSHNVVIGAEHGYSSYGGLVAGHANTVSAPSSSVTGGDHSVASGEFSAVSGGHYHVASGTSAWAGGGTYGTASGDFAAVAGGYRNAATALSAAVAGGFENTASEEATVVSGGYRNIASGLYSSVSGGERNDATGKQASICGGSANTATAIAATVSGGYLNDATGGASSISGGYNNSATAYWSSVHGGKDVTIDADYAYGP